MPIVRTSNTLIFYAHVPKCGGSAVQDFLAARFGPLAFEDRRHHGVPPHQRWSKTSPQHIDRTSLARLFPEGFFDAQFTIVRHPVSRLISAYHFQLEVEQTISKLTNFSEWLQDLADGDGENPFRFDNHIRPMNDLVPDGAKVFYLEHGLDALVPYFDAITGEKVGPRYIAHANKRGQNGKSVGEKAKPSDSDLELIKQVFGADFDRFGYAVEAREPLADRPFLSPEYVAERDRAMAADAQRFDLSKVKSALKRFY